jgi:hypothetical protein
VKSRDFAGGTYLACATVGARGALTAAINPWTWRHPRVPASLLLSLGHQQQTGGNPPFQTPSASPFFHRKTSANQSQNPPNSSRHLPGPLRISSAIFVNFESRLRLGRPGKPAREHELVAPRPAGGLALFSQQSLPPTAKTCFVACQTNARVLLVPCEVTLSTSEGFDFPFTFYHGLSTGYQPALSPAQAVSQTEPWALQRRRDRRRLRR